MILSVSLLGYGVYAAIHDDFYLPGRRSHGMHLHGFLMWLVLAAMLCAVANLVSVVVDHYDVRPNEADYRRFAHASQVAGGILFMLALVLDLLVFGTATGH